MKEGESRGGEVTFLIPVMENPGRGQLFGEFRLEPCALRMDLWEDRLIIPLHRVSSGARDRPSPASGT